MEPNSLYRKMIIDKLLNKNIGSKSKTAIRPKDLNSQKMYIALKTPFAELTNNCTKYTYNINSTINTNLSELPTKYERVVFCIYRIIHCKIQKNVREPFLQYLLYKYPEHKKDTSNLMVFPFTNGKTNIKTTASNYMQKIINKKLDIIGFIEKNGVVYLFYDFTQLDDLIIKKIFFKTKKNTLWWCLIDEICNHKKVLQFPIHPSVYTLFFNNPALIYLKQDKKRIDIPIIGYYGNYFKLIPMVAALGQNASLKDDASENSYLFGSFRKGIRNGSWTPYYKQHHSFNQTTTDIDGKYINGGIIRFAIFMGSTKVIINENYENINKKWKLKYQSLFIGSIDFDKIKLNIIPEYIVKSFEQQIPLSYHEIDKQKLKPNWDPSYEKYDIN
jgi:hypothetical protein